MKPDLITLLAFSLCLPALAQDKQKPLPPSQWDFKSLKVLVEKGVARAQYELGRRYANGIGVEKDYKEAVKWFREAAEQYDSKAQSNLGVAFDEKGLPPRAKDSQNSVNEPLE